MNVTVIVGTRPQIIKTAPLIKRLSTDPEIDALTIHTGQHYDHELSQAFFDELRIPHPIIDLNIRGTDPLNQIAMIISRLPQHMRGLVIIPGDTNSALGGALAAFKSKHFFAHVEAGARSYDVTMVEEVNRRIIDHCANVLFAPTPECMFNLGRESVPGAVFYTGDTMYDVFLENIEHIEDSPIDGDYAVLTLHRAENVDNAERLRNILLGVGETGVKTIFPAHPRTKKQLKLYNLKLPDNIEMMSPIGYRAILSLIKSAEVVITDSGGLQKEAFWVKTPCVTTRDNTEWNELVKLGVNTLVGADPDKIVQSIRFILDHHGEIQRRFILNPFGDGNASKKIVEILKRVPLETAPTV